MMIFTFIIISVHITLNLMENRLWRFSVSITTISGKVKRGWNLSGDDNN